ncbi:hypothetical protein JRO89_XS03G0063900 [Xanthoceras sorbifolium]|uniref:Ankyrin repeat domain-containing protein n=1 Tax=Xanthoceras sorbifolium TaxID=99658 RepID=A0ABQ8I8W7_9ROSI|nr:hypothetical protein JRO89_XS03G0063900 [Xanthoceras sorbifolium]
MVGPWKAKVYDMHNVVVSIKSRRVPGAMTDDEFFSSCNENETETEELDDVLTEDERRQLEVALKLDSSELSNENGDGIIAHRHSCYEHREIPIEDANNCRNGETKQEKKGWFGGWRKRDPKPEPQKKIAPPRSSLCVDEKVSDLLGDSPSGSQIKPGRHSVEIVARDEHRRGRDARTTTSVNTENANRRKDGGRENEYKKGLRPILWLSPNFPLQTEELLPLLDILATRLRQSSVKRTAHYKTSNGNLSGQGASFEIQYLECLLLSIFGYKLLQWGTLLSCCISLSLSPFFFFKIKICLLRILLSCIQVAIPVVPTIRVLVTFTKFEELQPVDEFATPPSSPTAAGRESPSMMQSSSSSWFQWIKGPYNRPGSSTGGSSSRIENIQDPFAIPQEYTWITAEAKKKKMQEKSKTKKGKSESTIDEVKASVR